nr:MAG TPA: hypothetical protein [Caudoviricetes sp.]
MWCYLKEAEHHKEVISGVALPMFWKRKSSTLRNWHSMLQTTR